MSRIKIIQLGVGGSGAWAAELLMRAMVGKRSFFENNSVSWDIIDPDVVESKNLIRQHFIGMESIGTHKVDYMASKLDRIIGGAMSYYGVSDISIEVNPIKELLLLDSEDSREYILESLRNNDRVLLLSAVDNTLTRMQFEARLPELVDLTAGNCDTLYIDLGNSDTEWTLLSAPWNIIPKFIYNDTTYPDTMISCADREETTSVPQTTLMNSLVANYASAVASSFVIDAFPMYRAVKGNEKSVEHFVNNAEQMQQLKDGMAAEVAKRSTTSTPTETPEEPQPVDTPVETPVEESSSQIDSDLDDLPF